VAPSDVPRTVPRALPSLANRSEMRSRKRSARDETAARLAQDAYPKIHVVGKIAPQIEPW